jgi:hypothetical protein
MNSISQFLPTWSLSNSHVSLFIHPSLSSIHFISISFSLSRVSLYICFHLSLSLSLSLSSCLNLSDRTYMWKAIPRWACQSCSRVWMWLICERISFPLKPVTLSVIRLKATLVVRTTFAIFRFASLSMYVSLQLSLSLQLSTSSVDLIALLCCSRTDKHTLTQSLARSLLRTLTHSHSHSHTHTLSL